MIPGQGTRSHMPQLRPCVLVAQSCPILCDSMDCSPPGSSVHGILLARILEWVAISFSKDHVQPNKEKKIFFKEYRLDNKT